MRTLPAEVFFNEERVCCESFSMALLCFTEPFVHYNWRMSETLSGVYKFELVQYMCVYICMVVLVA